MRPLTREQCQAAHKAASPVISYDSDILQAGLGGDPWRVAVASMLLCRTRRVQVDRILQEMLVLWPDPWALACSGEALEDVVRPCGLQRNRSRQLQRFSGLFLGSSWSSLIELPGCGVYVCDAVGLVCFGYTDITSGDPALEYYKGKVCAPTPEGTP